MVAGDLLRLAWEAEHDGRSLMRDSLMTLAVAESAPGDAWAERCRARLVATRPDHYLARFASVGEALVDPRVLEARERLRWKFPAPRVQSLLLRARARRGPYLGRAESLDAMIEDLAGPSAEAENIRRDAPQAASRGPLNRHRAHRPLAWSLLLPSMNTGLEPAHGSPRQQTFPDWGEVVPEPPVDDDIAAYYLTVLLAIAFLLATVQQGPDARPRRL